MQRRPEHIMAYRPVSHYIRVKLMLPTNPLNCKSKNIAHFFLRLDLPSIYIYTLPVAFKFLHHSRSISLLYILPVLFSLFLWLSNISTMARELMKKMGVVCGIVLLLNIWCMAQAEPQVPCYFIFGDSLVDNGNNNQLQSLARANYLPYGIDFPGGPTGRFSNGKTTVDVVGEQFLIYNFVLCLQVM